MGRGFKKTRTENPASSIKSEKRKRKEKRDSNEESKRGLGQGKVACTRGLQTAQTAKKKIERSDNRSYRKGKKSKAGGRKGRKYRESIKGGGKSKEGGLRNWNQGRAKKRRRLHIPPKKGRGWGTKFRKTI